MSRCNFVSATTQGPPGPQRQILIEILEKKLFFRVKKCVIFEEFFDSFFVSTERRAEEVAYYYRRSSDA
jgi:hypothetical protein